MYDIDHDGWQTKHIKVTSTYMASTHTATRLVQCTQTFKNKLAKTIIVYKITKQYSATLNDNVI